MGKSAVERITILVYNDGSLDITNQDLKGMRDVTTLKLTAEQWDRWKAEKGLGAIRETKAQASDKNISTVNNIGRTNKMCHSYTGTMSAGRTKQECKEMIKGLVPFENGKIRMIVNGMCYRY